MAEFKDQALVPVGFEQVTALSTAAGLTPPAKARFAIIQAQDATVRWRDDGTDPTATVGMKLAADEELFYAGDLKKIKFIETAAGAELNVSYYR